MRNFEGTTDRARPKLLNGNRPTECRPSTPKGHITRARLLKRTAGDGLSPMARRARSDPRDIEHAQPDRRCVLELALASAAEEISENPCYSGNLEGLGVFAPIRMIAGI